MTKDQAEALYPLVNSNLWMTYEAYLASIILKLHGDLEWQVDKEAVRTQGKIGQIRDVFKLKEKVNGFLEGN